MKNSIFSLSIFLTLCLLIGCGNDETLFDGPSQVRFTELEAQEIENFHAGESNLNEPIRVSVHLVAPLQQTDTRISYRLEGSAEEGVDYTILSDDNREIIIPAGESFGFIEFELINNSQQDGDRVIVFSLTGADNNLRVSNSDQAVIGRNFRFTINDDDCLQNLRIFEGVWEAEEEAEGTSQTNQYELIISPDFSSNNRLLITNFGGTESLGGTVYANLDLCNNEFIIPEQVVQNINGGRARTVSKGTFSIQDGGTLSFTYTLDTFGDIEWTVNANKND
ncbi:MAG: hypothetical protein ACLFT3_18930 [Cyclobacteriaceae bacterium]